MNVDGDDDNGGGGDSVKEETPANLAKLDPLGDEDGDSLANAVEIEGWTIRIDTLGGVSAGIRDQHVTSNPFVADTDKDGLSDLLERAHSADPRVRDTDGDGLSDFFEVREGWLVTPTNGVTYRVYSNPSILDSDGDGLRDDEEVGWSGGIPTDPITPDTDFDGYNDLIERVNSSGTLNPVRPDERTAPVATCTYAVDPGSYNRTYTVTVSDAAGDINRVLLDVGDGSPNQVRTYVPEDPQPTTLSFSGVPLIHPTVSLARVFVRDQTGDQTMARCTQSN